jgi:hypothetical protein
MGKTILLVVTSVLVLSAGVVVGRLSAYLPEATGSVSTSSSASTRPTTRPWWGAQLDLSSEQAQQMEAIWSDTRQKMMKLSESRHDLDHQQEQAIRDLFPSDDLKAQYDQLKSNYKTQRADMDTQRQKLIDDANERSRALLTDEQKTKWDAQRKQWHEHRGNGGPGGPSQMNHSTTRPTENNNTGSQADMRNFSESICPQKPTDSNPWDWILGNAYVYPQA